MRKRVLAEHDFLTMTKLYNVRERLKEIELWEAGSKKLSDAYEMVNKAEIGKLPNAKQHLARKMASAGPPAMASFSTDSETTMGRHAPRPLSENEKAIHDAGCVGVIHELHQRIDAAVA